MECGVRQAWGLADYLLLCCHRNEFIFPGGSTAPLIGLVRGHHMELRVAWLGMNGCGQKRSRKSLVCAIMQSVCMAQQFVTETPT